MTKQDAIEILQKKIERARQTILTSQVSIMIFEDKIRDLRKPGLHPEYEYINITDDVLYISDHRELFPQEGFTTNEDTG